MQYANGVNELVVRFKRLTFNEDLQAEMLVMERIYPIDFRTYEVERRELWLSVFMDEMAELHHNGFVRHDIKRPSNISGQAFDNILLTQTGLRLIDVGIFEKYLDIENAELKEFADYFINR